MKDFLKFLVKTFKAKRKNKVVCRDRQIGKATNLITSYPIGCWGSKKFRFCRFIGIPRLGALIQIKFYKYRDFKFN